MAAASTHHPTHRLAAGPLVAMWLALCASHTAAQPIRHAMAQQQSSQVITYELEVLQLLLEKTRASHGDYGLQATEVVTQNRAFLQLQAGEVDVLSSMSSTEREVQGLALRVCLYRGLLGVRLPVVLAGRAAELDALDQPGQLRSLRHGQVSDWPDSQILLANGWRVERMPRLAAFAELLRRDRIDTFALGAIEVYPIADAHPGLTVLQRWAIAYPSAFYFFVSPKRPELAERLRRGWELALADGSFVALFEQRIGPQLARARLDQRRWMVLSNPLLPPDTPLDKTPYWHPLVRSKLLLTLNSGKPRQ